LLAERVDIEVSAEVGAAVVGDIIGVTPSLSSLYEFIGEICVKSQILYSRIKL